MYDLDDEEDDIEVLELRERRGDAEARSKTMARSENPEAAATVAGDPPDEEEILGSAP